MVIILEPGHQDANRPGGGSPAPWGCPRVFAPLPPSAPGLTRHHCPGSACIAEARETEGLSLGSRPGSGLATALHSVPCRPVTSLLPQRPPGKPSPGSKTCRKKTLQFLFLFKVEEHERNAKPAGKEATSRPSRPPAPPRKRGGSWAGQFRKCSSSQELGVPKITQLFTYEGKVNDTEKPSVHVRFVGTVPSAGFPAPLPGALLGEALPFFPFPDRVPSRPFVPLCRLRAHTVQSHQGLPAFRLSPPTVPLPHHCPSYSLPALCLGRACPECPKFRGQYPAGNGGGC